MLKNSMVDISKNILIEGNVGQNRMACTLYKTFLYINFSDWKAEKQYKNIASVITLYLINTNK